MEVPFFRPSIGARERAAVDEVLRSGWLTSGRVVKRFEERFARYLGTRHAVAVNSCTAALHLSLEALGVSAGDVVAVPTMTFAATAAIVCHLGARPVLVDCDPATLCVDPAALEAVCERWSRAGKLKAIIAMHYAGGMARMDRIAALGRRYGVPVIEDAAHALPASIRSENDDRWVSVGDLSEAACFSFYANKCITTGEGGMIATDNAALAERARMMSLHGLSRSAWNRFRSGGSWSYEIMAPGYKYNLTDLAAAIGVVQLERAGELRDQRRSAAEHYSDLLAAHAEFIEPLGELPGRRSSWHIYPVRLRLESLAIDRDEFIRQLAARGITCSVHWMPLHLHPYYRETFGYRPEQFPVATAEWRRIVTLPLFPGITEAEIDYVVRQAGSIATENRLDSALARARAVA